jgi:hypothetical protein
MPSAPEPQPLGCFKVLLGCLMTLALIIGGVHFVYAAIFWHP